MTKPGKPAPPKPPEFEPVEHTELADKVYGVLKAKILSQEFAGGQRLNLADLASQLRVSRTPLKDAVNRLAVEGYVEVRPRSGTFVREVGTEAARELMDARLMIELWSVSHLDPDRARRLAGGLAPIAERSRRVVEGRRFSYDAFLELDVAFHTTLVEALGNRRILEGYKSLNGFLQISRVFHSQNRGRSLEGQGEHERIVERLATGDVAGAVTAVRTHLELSLAAMLAVLDREGGAP